MNLSQSSAANDGQQPQPIDRHPDSVGRARGMDGSILNVSKEDFAALFVMHGSDLFCQPKKESAIRPSIDRRPLSSIDGLAAPEQNIYKKAEIDELVNEIYRVIRISDDFHSKRLDDICYPYNMKSAKADQNRSTLTLDHRSTLASKHRSKKD
ncbi:hypothetical protein F2Q68_00016431 [Brassica cretica]|uniref:Uncharacterized protein n=1 Tax=Brassica cretica TaxID=69181 RepID=A0A8S9HNZ2_BRACR|nr:hypothetical protein F2Q68_00016431 [Brassica cretica]